MNLLKLAGHEAIVTPRSLAPALRTLYSFEPEVVLFEVSGDAASREVFTAVENVSSAPTVILGEPSEAQQVWYLEHGAAEYLTPPISFALLHAHVRSVLRCRTLASQGRVIRAGDLEVDRRQHRVRCRGREIPLTPTEFRLLQALAENKGRLCSHGMLLEQVWGKHCTSSFNYLRLYVGYLRQKLEDDPADPTLIVTEWGIGYRLMDYVPHPSPRRQPAFGIA